MSKSNRYLARAAIFASLFGLNVQMATEAQGLRIAINATFALVFAVVAIGYFALSATAAEEDTQ